MSVNLLGLANVKLDIELIDTVLCETINDLRANITDNTHEITIRHIYQMIDGVDLARRTIKQLAWKQAQAIPYTLTESNQHIGDEAKG